MDKYYLKYLKYKKKYLNLKGGMQSGLNPENDTVFKGSSDKELLENISNSIENLKNNLVETEINYLKNFGITESDTVIFGYEAYQDFEKHKESDILNSIKFYKSYIENKEEEYNINLIDSHGLELGTPDHLERTAIVPDNIILIFMIPINRFGYQESKPLYERLYNYGNDSLNPFNYRDKKNECMNFRHIALPGQRYINSSIELDKDPSRMHGLYDNIDMLEPAVAEYDLIKGEIYKLSNLLNFIAEKNKDKKTIVYVKGCRRCHIQDPIIRFKIMFRERMLDEINAVVAKTFGLKKNSKEENCTLLHATIKEHDNLAPSSPRRSRESLTRVYTSGPMSPNKNIYKIIASICTFKIDGKDFREWTTQILKTIEQSSLFNKDRNPYLSNELNDLHDKMKFIFENKDYEEWSKIIDHIYKNNPGIIFSEQFIEFKSMFFRIEIMESLRNYAKAIDLDLISNIEYIGDSLRIDWSNKKLKRIPPITYDLGVIETLDLRNNNIKKIWKNDKFYYITNLYLSNNKLQKLSISFGGSKFKGDLNLSNNDLTDIPYNFSKVTVGGNLNLSNNTISELPENFNLITVGGNLDLSNNYLTDIPEYFPNVKGKVIKEPQRSWYSGEK